MVPNRSPIGRTIAEWTINNHDALGVKYVIWGQKIWNREIDVEPKPWTGWRNMGDRGSDTANHWWGFLLPFLFMCGRLILRIGIILMSLSFRRVSVGWRFENRWGGLGGSVGDGMFTRRLLPDKNLSMLFCSSSVPDLDWNIFIFFVSPFLHSPYIDLGNKLHPPLRIFLRYLP